MIWSFSLSGISGGIFIQFFTSFYWLVLWISCLQNCNTASFIHLERLNVTDTANPLLSQALVSYRTLHCGRSPFVAKDKGEQLV